MSYWGNQSNAPLAVVTPINLKSTGATTLYTVPTGFTLINAKVVLVCAAANTVTVAPIVQCGTAGNSYIEVSPLTTLTGMTAANITLGIPTTGAIVTYPIAAGGVVALNVQTGATATTLTATAYLFGSLI